MTESILLRCPICGSDQVEASLIADCETTCKCCAEGCRSTFPLWACERGAEQNGAKRSKTELPYIGTAPTRAHRDDAGLDLRAAGFRKFFARKFFAPSVRKDTETNLVRIPCTGQEPKRAHYDDAASDIRSAEDVTIKPGGFHSVKTGLRIALKPGYVALLFGRSGNGQRGIGITHGTGVIDAGFRGEIKVCLYNMGDEDFVIEEGDRIAQLMIIPIPFTRFTELDEELFNERFSESSRGTAGYGSTGRN